MTRYLWATLVILAFTLGGCETSKRHVIENGDAPTPQPHPAGTPFRTPDEQVYWRSAVERMLAGDYAGSLPVFEQFAMDYPGYEWARNNLGLCLMRTGDLEGARAELMEGRLLAPGNLAIVTNLAYVASGQRDLRGVIDYSHQRLALMLGHDIAGDVPSADELQAAIAAADPAVPGSEVAITEALHFECCDALRAIDPEKAGAAFEAGMAAFPDRWWFPEFYALTFVLSDNARAAELHAKSEELAAGAGESRESHIAYRLPIDGAALILQGHHSMPSHSGVIESYAWDFMPVRFDEAGTALTALEGIDGTANEHYVGWDQPVLAAADGVVRAVADGFDDNTPNGGVINYGNGVLIAHTDAAGREELSVYWHLRNGSIVVKPGDTVKAGDEIGHLGSSGIAIVPHLHFVVRRGPLLGVGLDARFAAYELHGPDGTFQPVASGSPAEGSVVRAAE